MRIDKPVLLYGAGQEARSTRAFLAKMAPRLRVCVTADSGPVDIPDTEFIPPENLAQAMVDHRIGLIVKSPGVSRYKPVFAQAEAQGVVVTSNLNLWGAYYREGRQVIVITGTKGKSTTATFLHLMLQKSGLDAGLAGNVGLAPLDIADKHKIVVFELSSYQTASMDFAPDIAAITNLWPEHVDWHGSVDRYYADKLRVLDLSSETRLAFGPEAATNPVVTAHIGNPARLLPALDSDIDQALRDAAPASRLKGQHNLDNALLAAQIAAFLGANAADIVAAIEAFQPLPHRLAESKIGNHTIVDDSISTTPEATKAALAAYFGHSIALIAGGYDRQQNYEDLARRLPGSGVRYVATLPVTGDRLAAAIEQHALDISVIPSPTLEEAVRALAMRKAHFDTLILSPGAPSYNQFKNFEERGDAFVALARRHFG